MHIGLPAAQSRPARHIKRPARPELHRGSNGPQQQRIQRRPQFGGGGKQPRRPGKSRKAAEEQDAGGDSGHDEPGSQAAFLPGPGGMARGIGAGISIGNVGRGSSIQAVAGDSHGGGQGGDVGIAIGAGIGGSGIGISGCGWRQADGGALGSKVDADGADAVHRAQRLGNMMDTGGAGHTGHGKGQGLGFGAPGRPAGGGVIRWLCHPSASGGL